jgi:hypothetical protein
VTNGKPGGPVSATVCAAIFDNVSGGFKMSEAGEPPTDPAGEPPTVPVGEPVSAERPKRRWLLPTLVGVGAFVLGLGVGVAG